MDPPSLDTAIQHALAGLYPPFEATAPTILGQVFRLLDSDFRGDGLSFLLDFLIPAKRLCEQVREAACAPYAHCLFLHEGWPLCLRGKVVLHLAPLSPLSLREGDFYLQVEPREEQAVCITVKRLSSDLRTVDTKPVPVSSYPLIFTPAWLEAINSDFEGSPLRNCLVASEDGIVPVPWTKITCPEFVDDRPQEVDVLSPAWGSLQIEALDLSSPRELHQTTSPGSQVLLARSSAKGKDRMYGNKYPGLIKVEQAGPGEAAFRMDDVASQDLEGDYVALLDFPLQSRGGSPSREVGKCHGCPFGALEEASGSKGMPVSQRMLPLSGASGGPSLEKWACAELSSSEQEPCILDSRKKVNHQATNNNSARQPQEPDCNVLGNPLHYASGLEAGVAEKPAVSKMQGPLGNLENMVQLRPGPKQASSPRLRPAAPAAPAPETKMGEGATQVSGRLPKAVTGPSRNTSSSRSPTPGLKFSFLKGQRQAPEKASLQHDRPWKVLCSLHSPTPPRARCSGKAGTSHTKTSGLATDSGPLTGEKTGFPEASTGPPERGRPPDAEPPGPEPGIGALSVEVLHSGIACLPGGRDKAGRPLLLMSTTQGAWEAPWCTASEVTKLLSYLCTVSRGWTLSLLGSAGPPPSCRPPSRSLRGATPLEGYRSHLAEATALYSLMDEQLHVLVTASNHLLGRLELRVRLGRLEAAILQVSNWMEQEGSRCLRALTPRDGSLETVEQAHAAFEDFFLQAAAQYRRGLELSKQAAQLGAAGGAGEAGGAELPELAAFAATQRAFQAKLTHFYMAAERQRTDLETQLHLHHFCKRMTWFHRDCQDLMTQLRLGKAQRTSPGDQRRLHRYLQRLASEFPEEKLTAMGLQVASLSREGLGQDLWEEAWVRHEEIQTLLKKAVAHCPCPAGPTAHSAHPEPRGAATKGQGLNAEVTSKGRRDLPLQHPLGLDSSPKSCWPPWAPRVGRNRNFLVGPQTREAGQAVEAEDGEGPREPLDPAPERSLATLFSWQRLARQGQSPRPTGGSFSSEGTDSQTSLEDSPQTSPPASL
ncbi:uncharacterized protein KIAA1755 homolog isoform X4 [Equus przewalskii]|uniref:Uncharacterized protein KIAA1755 homolog isoform X4 n=1 Tax=Equus przewalskii TaxID=9798 RepID=A0ABM4LXX6_EQUPR